MAIASVGSIALMIVIPMTWQVKSHVAIIDNTNRAWISFYLMEKRVCSIDSNKARCNCTYEPCSRKGICCECITYHRQMDELPACYFPANIEKTYDRSISRFIECAKRK